MTKDRSAGTSLHGLTTLLLIVAGALALVVPTSGAHAAGQDRGRHHKPVCGAAAAHHARCAADIVTDANGHPLVFTAASGAGLPSGPGIMGPTQFHTAYNLPCAVGATAAKSLCATPSTFGGQTIGIVDAYDDPTAESDLARFSADAGLPPCTTANGCFRKVAQDGSTTYPSYDPSWSSEENLDVQVAHEICQTCKILLVEATSDSDSDLAAAVDRAATLGATEISNSYGGHESSTADDSHYIHLGVVIVASSGDYGYADGPNAPANIPQVVSVGGTSLYLNNDNTYNHETAWDGAGSGCSTIEMAPSWQTSLSNWSAVGCGMQRNIADVSADADPSTGAMIYSSPDGGYVQVGGTSLAAPLIAAVYALAGGSPLPAIIPSRTPYVKGTSLNLHDVTTGSNGSCSGSPQCTAGPGYDGPTGLGTPNGVSAFVWGAAPLSDQTIAVTTHAPGAAAYHATFTVAATASSGLAVTYASSGSCVNSGATYTMTSGSGACTVFYRQSGDATYTPAPDVVEVVTAQAARQTITFGPLSNKAYGDPPITVSATASSGLPVSFSVGSADQCAISGSTVTITGAGSCTVTASQAGDSNDNAAPSVSQSFTIATAAGTITLDASSLSATYDGTPHLATATTNPGGLSYSVSYTDANNTPVTNPINAGSYTVSASVTDPNYSGRTTGALVIAKANQSIAVTSPAPSSAAYNATFTVAATASSGLSVVYGSSGSCSNTGATVTMTSGRGACTVTVDQAGNGNYNAAQEVTDTVTAQKATQTITFGALANHIFGDAPFQLNATASSGLPVSFSATGACAVSGATVIITGAGSCTVTASQAGNTNDNPAPNMAQTFSIAQAGTTTTITSSVNPSILKQGVTFTVTVTSGAGTPSGAVTIKDGATTLASGIQVDAAGSASFTTATLSAGTHSITASYSGNANFSSSASSPALAQQMRYDVNVLSAASLAIVLQLQDYTGLNVSASNLTVTAECVVAYAVPAPTACGSTPVQSITKAFGFTNNYKGRGSAYTYSVNPHGLTKGQQYDLLVQTDGDPVWHAVPFTA